MIDDKQPGFVQVLGLVQFFVANDEAILADVRALFGKLDRADQGESLIERCVSNAVSINNEGVTRAKNGDLAGAIELLEEAARAMPDNVQIVMNAAHSLIAHMQMHGLQNDKLRQVKDYLERVAERNPAHPKYLQVFGLYAQLAQKSRASGREAAA